jgi:phage baseplate assembly protein W
MLLHNSSGLEESIKLNNQMLFEKVFELEEKIAGKIELFELDTEIEKIYDSSFFQVKQESEGRYIVSIQEEIIRLLTTPLGSRVMRLEYGSELYKLRDRKFGTEWRLMAIKYTFEAINRYIERLRCRKVLFELQGDGKIKMKIKLEQR